MADRIPTTTPIRPTRGRVTFDSEGTEGGRYHSRVLHVPGTTSGLTIGRGYDMGSKSAGQIATDLIRAGVEVEKARTIAGAANLRGAAAKKFIDDHHLETFEITPQAQKTLFESSYEAEAASAKAVCERASTRYGTCNWEALHPAIKELVVDLKYRGDYTPRSRELIQQHIVANDLAGLSRVLTDRSKWSTVPPDRFARRAAAARAALEEKQRKDRANGRR